MCTYIHSMLCNATMYFHNECMMLFVYFDNIYHSATFFILLMFLRFNSSNTCSSSSFALNYLSVLMDT